MWVGRSVCMRIVVVVVVFYVHWYVFSIMGE